MAKHIEDEIVYHYDLYPTEEDWMGQTSVHGRLIRYLVDVLTWLFWGQRCALYDSLNFYQTPDIYEYPMSPDIAVIKGVDDIDVTSWRVNKDGPPQVVFEILSAKTWKVDINEKPSHYARIGVQEYFAYDPNTTPPRPQGFLATVWLATRALHTPDAAHVTSSQRQSLECPPRQFLSPRRLTQ